MALDLDNLCRGQRETSQTYPAAVDSWSCLEGIYPQNPKSWVI